MLLRRCGDMPCGWLITTVVMPHASGAPCPCAAGCCGGMLQSLLWQTFSWLKARCAPSTSLQMSWVLVTFLQIDMRLLVPFVCVHGRLIRASSGLPQLPALLWCTLWLRCSLYTCRVILARQETKVELEGGQIGVAHMAALLVGCWGCNFAG